MQGGDTRPDPDALLRKLQGEARREGRARLRIFFGFAPGVGKTYRMLQVARELLDQGVDLVVGAVETHGRYETAALLLGMELLSRRQREHRGRVLEEFDLEGALARRPKVLLLDELAHTNVPGSKHAKRWQDALDLLDAGIDVYTTLNVQHVESLNDVVAQITHVRVRETVPDSMLERADEVELVDISPEELLARLREGKVYLPEQAARAAQHFFQRGNLLALRELALRSTAQRVDVDMQAYREEQGVQSTWPASERILVCVGPAPASARLIRAARRMAAGLRAPWVAAYVESTTLSPLSAEDHEQLESHLRLAESLGATVVRLSSGRVSEAVLAYARRHNVTRILIGKPTHSRLRDLLQGSLLDEIVRGSGGIDVHVISGDEGEQGAPGARASEQVELHVPGYLWSTLLVALTTGLAALARAVLDIPDVEMLYLLAVMAAAIRFGRGPSLLTSALSVAAYDFFFVAPRFTLAVEDVRYFLSFGMMFLVGLVLSTLTLRLRRQEEAALLREERTAALYALSQHLGSALDVDQVAAVTARHAADVFEAAAVVLTPQGEGLRVRSAWPVGASLGAEELGVARWVLEHGRVAGLGTDTLPGAKALCVPLWVGAEPLGVLALVPPTAQPFASEQRGFLEVSRRQVALALERARLAEQARQALLHAKEEEIRSSLLSSVSHDLRTPLAAITGAATALREETGMPDVSRRELLEAICEEAERLERLVSNLLDMTRLDSGAINLKREWVPLEELVGSALTRLEARLTGHQLKVRLPEHLPLLDVDPVLLEQLLVNLLENASKYTPPGTEVEIHAEQEEGSIVVEVADRGPGLPPGDEQRVFERFYRGRHVGVPGVGLGLPICLGIARAHRGTLVASNRSEGGAVFRLRLPVGAQPPLLPVEPVQRERAP
jgi:two-component system, OmpR family, sensor histidine kinase KdpD